MKMQKSIIFVLKKFEHKYLKDQNIVKLEITVNIPGNKEVLGLVYVISNRVHLKKSL